MKKRPLRYRIEDCFLYVYAYSFMGGLGFAFCMLVCNQGEASARPLVVSGLAIAVAVLHSMVMFFYDLLRIVNRAVNNIRISDFEG